MTNVEARSIMRSFDGSADQPDVVIALADGMVTAVRIPPGMRVQLRDYDAPDDYDDRRGVDEDGDSYQVVDFEGAPV
jgi:hypothetical protein